MAEFHEINVTEIFEWSEHVFSGTGFRKDILLTNGLQLLETTETSETKETEKIKGNNVGGTYLQTWKIKVINRDNPQMMVIVEHRPWLSEASHIKIFKIISIREEDKPSKKKKNEEINQQTHLCKCEFATLHSFKQ